MCCLVIYDNFRNGKLILRMFVVKLLSLLIGVLSVNSNVLENLHPNDPRAPEIISKIYSPEKSLLQFSVDFNRVEVSRRAAGFRTSSKTNIMFSPISILTALNILMLGSSGNTEEQLKTALNYPPELTQALIHSIFSDSVSKLLTLGRGVEIKMSNGVFLNRGFPVSPNYLNHARAEYNATVENLDFDTQEQLSRQLINNFISERTNGRIKNMITSPLRGVTMLVANAVYFKGLWGSPFQQSLTRQDNFFIDEDEVVPVQMMVNPLTLPYVENSALGLKMVGLPYQGAPPDFGFFAILPDRAGIRGLEELEAKLSGPLIVDLINSMRSTELTIDLPKMSLSDEIDLKETLVRLGIQDLFDPFRCDLSGISKLSNLYVDSALHRANIDVNEKGSEFAAATVITTTRAAPGKSFRANRPFLFFIRDNYSGVPIFWARIVRPA